MEGGPGGSERTLNAMNVTYYVSIDSPAKLIVVDPTMGAPGAAAALQDTVIPSSATLDRVDVKLVSVKPVSVRV